MQDTITTQAIRSSDVIALIAAHIVTADREIDDKELKTVNRYRANDPDSSAYLKQVYEDSEDKISFTDLLSAMNNFSKNEIVEAYELFMKVSYADGYFHPEENQIITTIRKEVPIDEKTFRSISKKAKEGVSLYTEKDDSILDSLKETTYGLLSKFSFKEENLFRKKQKDLIFKGSKFVSQIKEISEYAQSDLNFAEPIVKESIDRMYKLIKTLDEQQTKLKKTKKQDEGLNEFIFSLKNMIETSALKHLEKTENVLEKKKRTIDYFTISFLGRTKAGKSTLHSIMVNDGDDDIGEGKLRTTRYNRVYNWENLRIVDTPGIGAPGGDEDEKIAESIIDESDLICYIVTNDAIQETEFKFLAEIKKRNKPVIILLNVKGNLSGIHRERFLKNPKKWIERTDGQSIQGHIKRIDEYMVKYYGNCFYKVIPVMLLAAKIAEKESNEARKKLLHDSSHIDDFLREIKNIVFDNGHLRKSQNIIDGCSFRLNDIYKKIKNQEKLIQEIIDRLTLNREDFTGFIQQRTPHYETMIKGVIDQHCDDAKRFARDFSLDNFALSEAELKNSWEREINDRRYFKDLEKFLQFKFNEFNEEIGSRLEEQVNSFEMFFKRLSFDPKTSSTFNFQGAGKLAGSFLGVVAGALSLVAPPVAIGVGIVAVIIGLGSPKFFKSKAKKIEVAQKKIEAHLIAIIEDQRKKYIEKSSKELKYFSQNYKNLILENLGDLIENSEFIKKELTVQAQYLEGELAMLHRAMAIRIFQQVDLINKESNIKTTFKNDQTIQAAHRAFKGESLITIKTYHTLSDEKIESISQLIQSKMVIENI